MNTNKSVVTIRVVLLVFTTIVSMMMFRSITGPMGGFDGKAFLFTFILCFLLLPIFVLGCFERAISSLQKETGKKASRDTIKQFFETLSRSEDRNFHETVMTRNVEVLDRRGEYIGTTTVSMMLESKKEEFLKTLKD
jgi:hypothetical protein